MRRIIGFMLVMIIVLSGCAAQFDSSSVRKEGYDEGYKNGYEAGFSDGSSSASEAIVMEEFEQKLASAINGLIPYDEIYISRVDNGRLNIAVTIKNEKEITYFATYVDALVSTSLETIGSPEINEIILHLHNRESEGMLTFKTATDKYGVLIDWRSGESKSTDIESLEDLMDLFPASKIKREEQNSLSEEEYKIYNEVLDALNAEPNRPEEEILEELAPNYGMTADELNEFMRVTMDKIF